MKRVRHYFEPWKAAKSRAWESSYRGGPPPVEDPDVIERWQTARARSERDAEWVVWGSNMLAPTACAAPFGGIEVMDDGGIVVTVRRPTTSLDDPPDQQSIATRIVACVNACRGMVDPQGTIDDVRGLLLDLACGRAGVEDPRVLRCMARLSGPLVDKRPENEEWCMDMSG